MVDLQEATEGRHRRAGLSVELIEVTKRFGDFVAVDRVTLDVRPGEFLSLLGPSGSGKTTTLRMIGGFELPSEGRVMINGRDLTHVRPHRRPTNMVFQRLALFPHLNVFQNIAFGPRMRRAGKKAIAERVGAVLDLVGLPGFEQRSTRQLSGGQQQRVAIARALVNEPEVLLLDEPLGSLDLTLRLQMQRELKAIQHRLNTTFIYVTHDQTEALYMSDRIAVMRNGTLEQIGTVEEIYMRPKTEFVASFVGNTNLVPCRRIEVGFNDRRLHPSLGPLPDTDTNVQGDEVTVLVRPERLGIGRVADPAWEVIIQGTVAEVVFAGATISYRVAAGGLTFAALVANNRRVEFKCGDKVSLGWRAGDALVIGESASGAVGASAEVVSAYRKVSD